MLAWPKLAGSFFFSSAPEWVPGLVTQARAPALVFCPGVLPWCSAAPGLLLGAQPSVHFLVTQPVSFFLSAGPSGCKRCHYVIQQQHQLSMSFCWSFSGLLTGIGAVVMTSSDIDLTVVQAAPEQASKPAARQPQKVDAKSSSGGSGQTIEQRQKEARKWINDWRAR